MSKGSSNIFSEHSPNRKKKKKRTEGKVRIIIKIPKLKAVILPNKNKNAQRPRLRFCLIANEENGSKKVFFPS